MRRAILDACRRIALGDTHGQNVGLRLSLGKLELDKAELQRAGIDRDGNQVQHGDIEHHTVSAQEPGSPFDVGQQDFFQLNAVSWIEYLIPISIQKQL